MKLCIYHNRTDNHAYSTNFVKFLVVFKIKESELLDILKNEIQVLPVPDGKGQKSNMAHY